LNKKIIDGCGCKESPFPLKSPPLKGGLGGANKVTDINPVEALHYE